MATRLELTGQRFGKLVVIEYAGMDKHSRTLWKCRCDCGKEVIEIGTLLNKGRQNSCGCMKGRYRHGLTHTRLYNAYDNMIKRCYDKRIISYPYYGGRGIKVCDEWLDKKSGRDSFFAWAIQNGYSDDLTLDRIDHEGNYEPDNCRWADRHTQVLNRRVSKSKLGVRGVYERDGRYVASIRPNGKLIHLGTYDTIAQAKAARQDAELEYFGQVLD